jgi:prepilin-type N-terminal cleavage/methylation domain-containing protein
MKHTRGFTVIELLVVVSIIALLVGILLPAIGKARNQAKLTVSQSNLRNLSTAHATYQAEWNDRQLTYINDNFSTYGNSLDTAWAGVNAAFPNVGHPSMRLGCTPPNVCWGWTAGGAVLIPLDFNNPGINAFRWTNGKQLGQYISGRFYDPVFFAPKDEAAISSIETCQDFPGEWCPTPSSGPATGVWAPSYCLSPAAMFNPEVMRNPNDGGWQDPFGLSAGFRSPTASQTLYPDLKTMLMEHHWLQNRLPGTEYCNNNVVDGMYDGCEPYYFNAGFSSTPTTLFYDGHIEGLGNLQARAATDRNIQQVGYGLWSIDTPMAGDWTDGAGGGYFGDIRADWTSTSHHILTTDGIKGRDRLGDG